MKSNMIFHDIFINGIVPENYTKEQACAEGLSAWASVMCGAEPPAMFGNAMVEISKILGVPAHAESLSKYADGILRERSAANSDNS